MPRHRVGAAYEVLAGILGLVFTLRLTRVPGGAGVTFNIVAASLACVSILLGGFAWTNHRRARQLSVAFQLLQVPQITTSAGIFAFMVGVQATVRMEGWWLSLYTNGGVTLNALRPADPQPTVIGVNLVALVAAFLLRTPDAQSARLRTNVEHPDIAAREGESIEQRIAKAGEWINRERPRASFFAWPDRQAAEAGIARTFAEAASAEPGFPLTNIRSALRDPPDCIGLDTHGRQVAIEVTELVSGEANALAKRDRSKIVIAPWTRESFLEQVQARLTAKDRVVLIDGPFDEYIVLLHTDEEMLTGESVASYLNNTSFNAPRQIDKAFLLLSYDPSRRGYPYFRLPIVTTG